MASGTINLTQSNTSGNYIVGKIEWSSTANTSANTSSVTAKLYVRKDSTSSNLTTATSGTWTYSLTVNGSAASGSAKLEVLTDWVLAATKTVSVSHSSDGSKSITISGSVSAPSGTSYAGKTTSGSGTAALDTIARASTITSASDTNVGSKAKIKWTPASTSFRYKVKLTIGDWAWTSSAIHPNTTSAYTYTTPTISYSTAYELPNATSGTMTATLYTYSDSACATQIGSASSKTFTLTVPDNSTTKPTVTMTLEPVNNLDMNNLDSSMADAFSGVYIEGKSKVEATLSATGKYDATIKSYSMTVNGVSYGSDASYTSDYLAPYGDYVVTGYATDSRGYTGSVEQTITVIPYSKPKLLAASDETAVVAARCDKAGDLSDSGAYLKIKAKRSYSKVIDADGYQCNYCVIRYRYKLASAESYSDWDTILTIQDEDDEIETGGLLRGALAVDSSYIVQVQALDFVGESDTVTITVPTDKVYWHRDGAKRSFTFGGYVESENTFAVAEDITTELRGEVLIGSSGMTLKEYILAVISEGG